MERALVLQKTFSNFEIKVGLPLIKPHRPIIILENVVCIANCPVLLLQPTIYQTGCCHWHRVGKNRNKKRKGEEKNPKTKVLS